MSNTPNIDYIRAGSTMEKELDLEKAISEKTVAQTIEKQVINIPLRGDLNIGEHEYAEFIRKYIPEKTRVAIDNVRETILAQGISDAEATTIMRSISYWQQTMMADGLMNDLVTRKPRPRQPVLTKLYVLTILSFIISLAVIGMLGYLVWVARQAMLD